MKGDLYSVEFFDLQLRFAQRVAELSGMSLADAVTGHTNIYVRLAMGQSPDANNPAWQEYLAGLAAAPDQAAWTARVHRRRLHLPAGPTLALAVGCFSYALVGPGHARLHFHAGACDSPLSLGNQALRRSELATLFSHLKASSSDGMQVVGASWLYNLEGYRRLFPPPYLESLRAVDHPYQRMPL